DVVEGFLLDAHWSNEGGTSVNLIDNPHDAVDCALHIPRSRPGDAITNSISTAWIGLALDGGDGHRRFPTQKIPASRKPNDIPAIAPMRIATPMVIAATARSRRNRGRRPGWRWRQGLAGVAGAIGRPRTRTGRRQGRP